MHDLMLKYEEQIAPDQSDSLHDLLDDLGPCPTVASLLGIREILHNLLYRVVHKELHTYQS